MLELYSNWEYRSVFSTFSIWESVYACEMSVANFSESLRRAVGFSGENDTAHSVAGTPRCK